MSKTTVVNVRTTKAFDVYMGRGGPFGNPYAIGPDGDREEVLRLFKTYFNQRIKIDPLFRRKVEGLRGRILGCFCRPENGFQGELWCHVQVIAGYLDGVPPEHIS